MAETPPDHSPFFPSSASPLSSTPRAPIRPPIPATRGDMWNHILDLRSQLEGLRQRIDNRAAPQPATEVEVQADPRPANTVRHAVWVMIRDRCSAYMSTHAVRVSWTPGGDVRRNSLAGVRRELNQSLIPHIIRSTGDSPTTNTIRSFLTRRIAAYLQDNDQPMPRVLVVQRSRRRGAAPQAMLVGEAADYIGEDEAAPEDVWRLGYYAGITTAAMAWRCKLGAPYCEGADDPVWKWTPFYYTSQIDDEDNYGNFFDDIISDETLRVIPEGIVWAVIKGPLPTLEEREEFLAAHGQVTLRPNQGPTRRINLGGQSDQQSAETSQEST